MPLRYKDAPGIDAALVQGEILIVVYELRQHAASKPHSRVIVLTNVCDLEQDHNARIKDAEVDTSAVEPDQEKPDETTADRQEPEENTKYVPYIVLCDLVQTDAMLRRLDIDTGVLEKIQKSQVLRYHHLPAASYGPVQANNTLPELYIDFRKTFALPTEAVYKDIRKGNTSRVAVVPDVYMHDLVQRQHSYLGRVGLPPD